MNAPAQDPRHPGLVLAVLASSAFMASLDLFIVNVAFEAIGRQYHHASAADLSWILNAYAIAFAALLTPLGRLADRFGRKGGFLAGTLLFVLASAAGAASGSLWMLVAARAVQAIGAALLTPTSLALVVTAMPPERRDRAVRVWAASGAFAAAAGPVIGGLLVQASWRWVFVVNVPVGLVAVIVGAVVLRDSRDPGVSRLPDLAGAVLLALGIGGLALGVVEGHAWGWGGARIVGTFVGSAVALAAFAWRTGHHPVPVVEPGLLRVRAFAWSNVTAVAFTVAFALSLLAEVLWMQQLWHYSALRAGLGVAPGPAVVPLLALGVSGRVVRRWGPGAAAGGGCLLFGLGAGVTLLCAGPHPGYAAELLPGWLTCGAGVGLALPTILSAATLDLPPERRATGSAVINMSRQLGSVIGVSVLIALIGAAAGYPAVHRGFERGWLVAVVLAGLGAAAALRMNPRRTAELPGAAAPAPIAAPS